jgi:DNA-binding transcriptional regulator YdaS (Cro superfamily)
MPENLLDRTAALAEAIEALGSKKALLEQLNKRGHDIRSHNVVSQWLRNGVPAKYCPDIEALTGVTCERLCPDVNWGLVRDRRKGKR